MLALVAALVAAWLVPAAAQAAGELFVSSQKTPGSGQPGITGLVQLADAGTETLRNAAGGSAIAGTGAGPIVYNSGGNGSISQLSGNSYVTLATNVGGGIRSMTMTGHGLVVANANKLQYLSNGTLVDVPGGTLTTDGPWISITTEPNGLLLGWAFRGGEGRLYELNLNTGVKTPQDFTHATSPTLDNCVPIENPCTKPPVPNSGSISADGQGGIWIAGAGTATGTTPDSQSSQLYYATSSSANFNSIDVQYTRPHVATTAAGGAYVISTDNSAPPYFGEVFKFTASNNNTGNIVHAEDATHHLDGSFLENLAVDRCPSASCPAVAPAGSGGGGGGAGGGGGGSGGQLGLFEVLNQQVNAPSKSARLGKKGLSINLSCSLACSVSISGKLSFGKARASASSDKLKKVNTSLKAGKSKTVTIKLSKKQRKKVKKALKKKQKVYAKLTIVVKAPGAKTVTKHPKLRIK
jgi:hypothetical protein